MSSQLYKYPRTPHLPWSPGATSDDVYLNDTSGFEEREVVVTEKMDGENTSMYRDHLHARSLDSQHHDSRNWVKALHGQISYQIPEDWRLCGENVYACHSIAYSDLASYFFVFSVWDADNRCLSWEETKLFADDLGLEVARELFLGTWEEEAVRSIQVDESTSEGYVARIADGFHFDDFPTSIGKWVRTGHVQTDQHWMHAEIVPNELADPSGS